MQTANFNVKVLEAAESGLRVSKGVVNELVAESAAGSGQIIPVIQARTHLDCWSILV